MGLGSCAAPASADHHIMNIREVFPGPSNTGFVELQMPQPGQQFVSPHDITTYGATGTLLNTFEFPEDVDQGTDQRTILVGENSAAGTPDFSDNALNMDAAGGGACFISDDFGPIDCVSWGNFTGTLPSGTGDPASPLGVTAGKSLERSIAQGCATKLDGPDDSDDSATDFSEQTPSPRNNTVTPTETNCPVPPATTLSTTGRPTNPTNQTSATFNFTATGNFTGFECKLDTDAGFAACTNPKTYTAGQIAEGSRTFQVRAVGPGGPDATPAFYTWRVDTTPPDTEITDPKPASPNGGVQATLTFQALGSLAVGETQPTFACRLITPSTPSPTFSSCTSPSTQQTPASGTYTFEVRSTDQAGNPDPSPASHTWEVDLSNPDPPPETTITKAPKRREKKRRPKVEFASDPSGAGITFECRFDDKPFAACTSPIQPERNLKFGKHTFEVFATGPGGPDLTPDLARFKIVRR